jgi:hypothetical protein
MRERIVDGLTSILFVVLAYGGAKLFFQIIKIMPNNFGLCIDLFIIIPIFILCIGGAVFFAKEAIGPRTSRTNKQ